MPAPQHLRLALHAKCVEYIDQRIKNIQEAYNAAGESANDETKSSAGDKHETGRAMMQLEQEKVANQLSEALELKKNISKINTNRQSKVVTVGSVVFTNRGNFYIAIPAGKIEIAAQLYFAISPASPLASKLIGLSVSQETVMNGQVYSILKIS